MWTEAIEGFATAQLAARRSAGTIRLRRHYLGRLAAGVSCGPWAVTTVSLEGFLAVPGWSPETCNSARTSVRAFYAWGVRVGHAQHNPALALERVRIPRPEPRPTPDHVLKRAELAGSERDVLMLRLGAWEGLRRAEIARVHSDDVVESSLRIRGKGDKVRTIPLDPRLRDVIVEAGGWLFPSRSGGHLSADRVGAILRSLLGGPWTAHTLRHRFASRAYAAERDFRAVQELLGHSSVVTTQRYVAVPDGALLAAVRAAAA